MQRLSSTFGLKKYHLQLPAWYQDSYKQYFPFSLTLFLNKLEVKVLQELQSLRCMQGRIEHNAISLCFRCYSRNWKSVKTCGQKTKRVGNEYLPRIKFQRGFKFFWRLCQRAFVICLGRSVKSRASFLEEKNLNQEFFSCTCLTLETKFSSWLTILQTYKEILT